MSEKDALTRFDAAMIGSRLVAILLVGRLLAALPAVPTEMAMLKLGTSETSSLAWLMSATRTGEIMHLILIPLLGAAALFMWYRADKVAQSIVGGLRVPADPETRDRDLVAAFCAAAGWLMIMFSFDGIATTASLLTIGPSRPQSQVMLAAPFGVLLLGIILVVGRARFARSARNYAYPIEDQGD